jgi:hypothetical protein
MIVKDQLSLSFKFWMEEKSVSDPMQIFLSLLRAHSLSNLIRRVAMCNCVVTFLRNTTKKPNCAYARKTPRLTNGTTIKYFVSK